MICVNERRVGNCIVIKSPRRRTDGCFWSKNVCASPARRGYLESARSPGQGCRSLTQSGQGYSAGLPSMPRRGRASCSTAGHIKSTGPACGWVGAVCGRLLSGAGCRRAWRKRTMEVRIWAAAFLFPLLHTISLRLQGVNWRAHFTGFYKNLHFNCLRSQAESAAV